jgi:hypothetical protein
MERFETAHPGEPVPQVDPEDLKALWEYNRSADPREKATGVNTLKHLFKPGADIWAVHFRTTLLGLLVDKNSPVNLALWLSEKKSPVNLTLWSGEQAPWLAPWIKEGQLDEALFGVAAQVSMKWPKQEGREFHLPDDAAKFLKFLPFEVAEFRRLLEFEGYE